ncbi:MAG: hypothetical protein ACQETL_17475 [Bacteroidota bacterium]
MTIKEKLIEKINALEIDIKNSTSNFIPTEVEFLIKDSIPMNTGQVVTIKNQMNTHEKQEKLLNEAYNYLSYLESQEEDNVFRKASEKSLKKVWDNTEDDIYNSNAQV